MYRYIILEVAKKTTRKISSKRVGFPWQTIDRIGNAWVLCGIEQYHPYVNNNSYTNMMVQLNLDFALKIYNQMKIEFY